jgi:NCAIR mutase (PurE)-related protein
VPPVNRQNAQNKEVTDEDDCVRRSHSVSNAGGKTPADYTSVSSNATSTRALTTLTELQQLLDQVASGGLAATAAADEILQMINAQTFQDLGFARVDHQRALRQGFPEVVFGIGKTPEQIADISREIISRGHTLLVTRATVAAFDAVRRVAPAAEFQATARTITLRQGDVEPGRGTVLVAAAGTSDLPVAEEACVTAEVMGNTVDRLFDVGVAGLHRLLGEHARLAAARVVIVVAGMEGALPSVIGGLVRTPVVAVPTSIGYGASFGGLAALLGMLNSCAAGVSVVNIDNGFGAAAIASRINHL